MCVALHPKKIWKNIDRKKEERQNQSASDMASHTAYIEKYFHASVNQGLKKRELGYDNAHNLVISVKSTCCNALK